MDKKDIVGRFLGKEVYMVPDKKLNVIILPESLVKHILNLQEDNEKYKKESLEAIFKRTDFSILNRCRF